MPYCSSCSRLRSIEEDEPELGDFTVDEDGNIKGTVRIVNSCAECGEELTANEFDIEGHVDLDHASEEGDPGEAGDHDLEVEAEAVRYTDERPPRAKRRVKFYGVEVTMNVKCSCGASDTSTSRQEVQASHMEKL